MKFFITILFYLLTCAGFSQSYYSLIQEDDNKYLVTYDTAINGQITVSYIASAVYLVSLTEEMLKVEEEIKRAEFILAMQEERLRILKGKKAKLNKLIAAQ